MIMISKMKRLLNSIQELGPKIDRLQQSIGRVESRQLSGQPFQNLTDAEFQVSSQWGEDGIIQHLIRVVPIQQSIFVEFGVQNYTESNTRFLLCNNQWAGLVMDGSPEHIRFIKSDPIYWKYNLKVECAFIDRENINDLIRRNGISGDIGILSVDIDGNDYWVWQAIDCVTPRIVICEYNSLFGPSAKITVPYDKSFQRTRAHYSNLYWGASISAFDSLAREKGYILVGSNSAGNNVFFVRQDLAGQLRQLSAQDAYIRSHFRESRDEQGCLTYVDHQEGLKLLQHMQVFDLDHQRLIKLGELPTGDAART